MKKNLLLTLLLVPFSVVADEKEVETQFVCAKDIRECSGLQKGDTLVNFKSKEAVLYCDINFPILAWEYGKGYVCIYNGHKYVDRKSLDK